MADGPGSGEGLANGGVDETGAGGSADSKDPLLSLDGIGKDSDGGVEEDKLNFSKWFTKVKRNQEKTDVETAKKGEEPEEMPEEY